METPFDPAILLLEIYPKNPETPVLKNLCIHVFITVLFTRDKIWKQFKCPSVNEWIQKKTCGTSTQWNTTHQEERRNPYLL